jgi:hypothetical protein
MVVGVQEKSGRCAELGGEMVCAGMYYAIVEMVW